MNLELQRELFRRYPKFFRKPGKRLIAGAAAACVLSTGQDWPFIELETDRKTNGHFLECLGDDTMPFDERGIECGDGWFAIIDRLSQGCEHEIGRLLAEQVPQECWPRVAQIKEKFGTLRFRVRGPISDALRAQILHAEESESRRICEHCGQARTLQPVAAISSYCEAHQADSDRGQNQSYSLDGYDRQRTALRALLNSRLS